MSDHYLVTSDITHPGVTLIGVTAQCGGYFDQETLRPRINDWCDTYHIPHLRPVALSAALKRSMQDLAHGADRELKQSGRGGGSKFNLIQLDLDAADLEESDGEGVGRSEVTCSLLVDPNTPDGVEAYSVKITPAHHPSASLIRSKFDQYCGLLSATYDIKPWLTQTVFPALDALRSPDANGKYIMNATARKVEALVSLQGILRDAETHAEGQRPRLRLHCNGQTGADSATLDLVADAMVEESERVMGGIEKLLEGERALGKRALATQIENAEALQSRLTAFSESLGLAIEDTTSQIGELTSRLAAAALAMEIAEG